MFAYWSRIIRLAILRRTPREPGDVPVFSLVVPFLVWSRPVRHDGRSFADVYGRPIPKILRPLVPLRSLYLGFLFVWPMVAALRSLSRFAGAYRYWKGALTRPELALLHRDATFSQPELDWGRPDYAIAMYYAWLFDRARSSFFALDDKRVFHDACVNAGLPLPATLSAAEAIARGGEFVVKDPEADLGSGVAVLTGDELAMISDADRLVVQEKLQNHPSLLEFLPHDAPLCSLRVFTTKLEDGEAPMVGRGAIRMGRAGAEVDNTQQGGIWAHADVTTGCLRPGVTKKTYGKVRSGQPVFEEHHPDTKRRFVGCRLPWWDEAQALAIEAHVKLAPEALTAGWDLALAADAPVFLEVNLWSASYDYQPATDELTPVCRRIVERMAAESRVEASTEGGGREPAHDRRR